MGDPFLNYFALFLLIFVVVVLFYGIIAIHDIPAKIAESRHHPHQDAIHAAGWVSLFTLHALVVIGAIVLVLGLVLNFAPGPWVGAGGSRRRYW